MVLSPADVDALAECLLSLIEVTDVRAEVAGIFGTHACAESRGLTCAIKKLSAGRYPFAGR